MKWIDVVAEITEYPDRRAQIAETALDLAADGGNRAVTHSAVDRRLGLPAGSTSYYFRTRRALLDAAITRLTTTSSASFASAGSGAEPAPEPAVTIGHYLHTLVTDRVRDIRARFALAPDAAHDADLAAALHGCLFSRVAAVDLFRTAGSAQPESDADDLLAFCEGIAATALFHSVRLDPTPGDPSRAADTPDSLAARLRRRFAFTAR